MHNHQLVWNNNQKPEKTVITCWPLRETLDQTQTKGGSENMFSNISSACWKWNNVSVEREPFNPFD